MSAPVDVLAVLSHHAHELIRLYGPDNDLAAARYAVAELIEVANRAAIAATRGDENRPGTIRNADLDCLRAALARMRGEA